MKCLIIDDEPLAVKLLKDYASKVPDVEVVMAGSDVFEGLKLAQAGEADLIFLDIQMPELTGIQFMKVLNGKSKVILTTAYEEYALQAFDHDVVDYLLKPFSLERFMTAVQRARERLSLTKPAVETVRMDYIFVKSEYKMVKIELKDILYLESLRDYVAIHTTTGKILTLQSLRSFEETLDGGKFMRIHKSYIISVDKIGSVERKRAVIGETYLPVGETYVEAFWTRLGVK
ncbi:LytTR family DNA-binding domain-containing protein [Terrimonas sp. NA20]|uniref:LytTR family DNA-binding domain-containing protein n=1 Tax=Terrimonas ginsenosidimutans TaxID=2908004 RepID=A0ABS9KMZ4_9BACT|nr:LytTR family DNA-binding domain-containing protein [Terrimonas ginsenosidimutans]MCG2613697.1 LytTR family DNA-binding domain-containing protein [Terrimonas ginsenosidimutans]